MLYVKEANTRSQKKKENKVKKRGCGKAQGSRKRNKQEMKIIMKYYPLGYKHKYYLLDFYGSYDQRR